MVYYPKIGDFIYRCTIPVGHEGMGILVDGGNCGRSDNIPMVKAFLTTFGLGLSDVAWINPLEFEAILA